MNNMYSFFKLSLFAIICLVISSAFPTKTANATAVVNITLDAQSCTADAATTIQQALDLARDNASSQKRYCITIPQGTYSLNSQLKVYSNTQLRMNNVTLIRDFKGSMLRFGREAELSGSNGASKYSGFTNITIEGGTWDGNAKKNPSYSSSLVRFAHANNITIKNSTFTNVMNSHHIEFAACEKVNVTNCTFSNYYGKTTSNNEALQIDIMSQSHFPNYNNYDETPSKNVTVSGCKFINLQRGVGTHSGIIGSYFDNIVIRNNSFENIDGYAIIGVNYRKSLIANNVIKNCGSGISLRSIVKSNDNFYKPTTKKIKIDNNSNTKIQNNTITVVKKNYSSTAFGISLYGENIKKTTKGIPKGDYRLNNVTVTGNTVTMKNSGYGIWLEGTRKSTVSNNKVTCNIPASGSGKGNGDAIRLIGSTTITISKNSLANKTSNSKTKESCGIAIKDGSLATATNNTIASFNKVGILVSNKCTATLTSNKITGCKKAGITYYENSTGTIKKNQVKKCKSAYYISKDCKVNK